MKVLFVGSNPDNASSLAFERDITALQKRQMAAAGLDFSFIFLPHCPVEDLPHQLIDVRPDILHFAAHGEEGGRLVLTDESGRRRCPLTADMIRAFVDPQRPPVLVYLSACDSIDTAERLRDLGIAAIGATAPITNGAARASAVTFYDRLIRGCTINEAHVAARAVLQSVNSEEVDARLCSPAQHDVTARRLMRVPKVVAEPITPPKPLKDGTTEVSLRIGVVNYPRDTVRVAFYTPDSSFEEGTDDCYVDDWTGNCCWSDAWHVNGDFLVVATGASPSAKTFCEAVLVTEALENCRMANPPHRMSTDEELDVAMTALLGEAEAKSTVRAKGRPQSPARSAPKPRRKPIRGRSRK